MSWLCRRVGMYDATPFLWSPAWHDWNTRQDVCYPIGLHWLMRWFREVWLWTLYPGRYERREHEVYSRGWSEGFAGGMAEGRRERKTLQSQEHLQEVRQLQAAIDELGKMNRAWEQQGAMLRAEVASLTIERDVANVTARCAKNELSMCLKQNESLSIRLAAAVEARSI